MKEDEAVQSRLQLLVKPFRLAVGPGVIREERLTARSREQKEGQIGDLPPTPQPWETRGRKTWDRAAEGTVLETFWRG